MESAITGNQILFILIPVTFVTGNDELNFGAKVCFSLDDSCYMNSIKRPNFVLLSLGGLGAFWIADIINPGFLPVGVMVFLLIPVIIVDLLYPKPEFDEIMAQIDLIHSHKERLEDEVNLEDFSDEDNRLKTE